LIARLFDETVLRGRESERACLNSIVVEGRRVRMEASLNAREGEGSMSASESRSSAAGGHARALLVIILVLAGLTFAGPARACAFSPGLQFAETPFCG
jgi:hypothetical protein